MRKLLKLIAILVFAATGQVALAAVSFNLDTVFSGTAPAGPPPWMNVTFADGASNDVKVTIRVSGLTPTEFVSGVYLNYNPGPALPLTWTHTSGDLATISQGSNSFKADGDGFYDILLAFPTAAGPGRFQAGDLNVVYDVTGSSALHDSMFNSSSVGGDKGSFFAAAHVQGISSEEDDSSWEDDDNSGWIGSTSLVPEPEIYAMMGIGLALMGFVARRRKLQDAVA